ncbi:alpha-amylase family glycosyl hydrolase [Thalassobacillus pellis]|uniref:alpha-amylase family glycosyl hydrolase n=1 Tax=Thalassobacillus pellis TaxID=748008 RepID=UPI001EF96984|nr:alpha-amylase family glycosyl hydrolase [Thalassobacillus pellis]MBM7553385.1 sucrose phosphorylase [Thalassobacillus pellis]
MSVKTPIKKESIKRKLEFLYGEKSKDIYQDIEKLIQTYAARNKESKPWVTENDVMLITYGDSIREPGKKPLQTLKEFLVDYGDSTNSVHILPFYPYTSDDGFSVVDYREIDSELGNWNLVNDLAEHFDLMFDAVINHMSKSSEWFQGFLSDDDKYKGFFIEADPSLDYSKVTRPRALPLLTSFSTENGEKHVWTTFSEDQVDLNYKNPEVLLEILDILNMYVINGARYIRLDAIGFMWKRLGTSCMHLEETHTLIKLIREVLDHSAPGTILITETNVPHKDNISYFGNGHDEAQMVYQFPLPPLTLYSFLNNNARKLSEWADSLEPLTPETSYFNFLASHDGIGMRPTEGILSEEEKDRMVAKTKEHGGYVSYKDNGDGTNSPYELNINYLDALTHPNENEEIRIERFIAAQSVLLSVIGVPGVYIHSLLGSQNYYKGVEESGINRRINREKLDKHELVSELNDDTLRGKVFHQLSERIKLRRQQSAFHPNAAQEVLFLDDRVFSIIRSNEETRESILVLINVSDESVSLKVDYQGRDIISGQQIDRELTLDKLQTMWIKI